jgi:3-hydroxybutyryl-CoA dehydratase
LASLAYEQLAVGDSAAMTKTLAECDVYLFAGITGDMNPAHTNEEYAKGTAFKSRIVHGALLSGLISAVLGNQLPGNGTIYMKQTTKFLAPVYFGDTITAKVQVTELLSEKKRVVLRTWCVNQKGDIVLDGEALVSAPRH